MCVDFCFLFVCRLMFVCVFVFIKAILNIKRGNILLCTIMAYVYNCVLTGRG